MIVAVGEGECFAGADDVTNQATAKGNRLRPKRLALPGRRSEFPQAASQRLINEELQAFVFNTA